ncbi:MAG: hypothetical protein HQL31_09250 [Planctomycetes bacterium]|nr:hypothetical protein [Planctomycetota bacterium]
MPKNREPDFTNLLRVLDRKRPERPTLFEFFLNAPLNKRLAGPAWTADMADYSQYRLLIHAFRAAGYDYATVRGSSLGFPAGQRHRDRTSSMNEGAVITDRASFNAYAWPNPDTMDYSMLERIQPELPPGMKLIVCGPGGVLENVMSLVGYEATCCLTLDDPQLAADIFAAVGSRLVRHYELAGRYDTVGAMISNDDWGFKSQPMLSPEGMRTFVFPWHRKIVEAIHNAGKPAILHSCGNLDSVMDDIIDDMKYDGKHSYEDIILPVEEAYERWGRRIAILGGIDLDFICRSTAEQVHHRSLAMLERSAARGSYALGTGNSVPEYVPQENYFAMVSAATGLTY